jgi:hypothetical protein
LDTRIKEMRKIKIAQKMRGSNEREKQRQFILGSDMIFYYKTNFKY